ncbi:MAG TPA: hypothetical protein VK766_11035 [Cytophagaceae bacterium]|jgi:hypothetical protein|nr:hypothetical protein [Cytophagaceae bacterium]
MKNIAGIIFLLIGLPVFFATGQRSVMEVEMKGGRAQSVFSTTDVYSNIAYIFQGSKSIQISILDASYKMTKEFLINRDETEKKNRIIGATLSERNIVVYLFDHKERNFASLVVDRFTGNHRFNPSIGALAKHEFLMESFEMEGVFYSMVVPQHKNAILLFASNEGGDFAIRNYDVNFSALYSKLSTKNDELNKQPETPVGIERINYTIENNIKSAYPSKKMYLSGNKIFMTFEEPSHTHVVIIDPYSPVAIYRKLNFSLDKGKNTTPSQGNSFLYKGNLFRISFSDDELNLIVINLDSMQMLRSFNVFPDQPISFINGFVKEEGNDMQGKFIRVTSQYFKKLRQGKLAVAVNDLKDGYYEVELGAYEEVTVYRNSGMGGMGMGMGGMGMGMGMGGMGMGMGGIGIGMGSGMGMGGMGYGGYPGYYPNSGNQTTSIRVVYFQTLLRENDMSHVDGNVPVTMREKINDYEAEVLRNRSPDLLNVVPSHNGLLLGYYAKGHSRYNLVEFLK